MNCDICIVGAGLSGLVVAERMINLHGKTCVIVEKRDHIGGNCYDCFDGNGVLYHKYGPHYFRTNSDKVLNYLSNFTAWIPADYIIKSKAMNRLWSFPINLTTFEEYLEKESSEDEFIAWLGCHRQEIKMPANSEELMLSQVGSFFYETFFKNYTKKQWGKYPNDLAASVCGRIPIRTNRDQRYFSDKYQLMPKEGYTSLFQRLIESCGDKLNILLNTNFSNISTELKFQHLIYTGPIDEYFKYKFGVLPWRSLRFKILSITKEKFSKKNMPKWNGIYWQDYVQINYPNECQYTRTVEIKHVTQQNTPHTCVVFEYPETFEAGKEPYYPVPCHDSQTAYARYFHESTEEPNVSFLGRLGTYQYLNMDTVVLNALDFAERFGAMKNSPEN